MDFRNYLALTQPRPQLNVYAEQIGKAHGTLRRYASRFRWSERAKAWDDRMAKAEDEVKLTERQSVAREHLQALKAARTLGTIAIAQHLRKAQETGKVAEVPPRAALALIRDTIQLERLILGEATERVENQEIDADLSKLSGEEAELLLELLAKMENP